jgi:hypothetical protein
MGLRPVPVCPQAPAIDDVTNEVDRIGVMEAQEVEKKLRLASPGTQMYVGKEEGPKVSRAAFSHNVHPSRLQSGRIADLD